MKWYVRGVRRLTVLGAENANFWLKPWMFANSLVIWNNADMTNAKDTDLEIIPRELCV